MKRSTDAAVSAWVVLLAAVAIVLAPHSAEAQASADSAGAFASDSTADAESVLPASAIPDSSVTAARSIEREANPALLTTRKVRVLAGKHNVVRSGPGSDYAIVALVQSPAAYSVIAKSGEWFDVKLSDSESGWIHSSLVKEFDDLSDLEYKPNKKLYSRTGSFVASAYTGAYAFDRKSNSIVVGGRLGYYVFDRLQVDGGVAWTHVRRPAEIVESLFGLSLEAEDFHMMFYHLIATWELLPGRQMVPYLSGGVGSTIMQGESEPSYDFGAGTMLYLSKRTAMRWEVRLYQFQSGADHARRTNHNVEFTLGTALLF